MEAVPILMVIFGGIFGGIALITRVDGQSKLRILQEKRAIAELEQAAKQPAPLPAPTPDDPHAAAVLALRLPEPQRSQALELLCLVQDAPKTLDARSAFLIKQTQADYLPQTLRAFLDLTAGARQRLSAQGMDAETLLSEQLDLIGAGVKEALRLDHAAADRMLTQGRFLRERFAASEAGERVALEKT
ncbi:hypothetical protein EHF33_02635 [Deinococcus psychrotolerans]|uniref:Uncharacterized protein n=1 Tax=Deinococcus psychrotolerans TaxID=2489213 RepID=A0A3G8Y8S5_9DEIO|nr:hypothetical protein [Deinococcus psychrotolerans]AZI41779.1 hypothetical protein EHF33_02635 [Deinococcus psychrotolerans]